MHTWTVRRRVLWTVCIDKIKIGGVYDKVKPETVFKPMCEEEKAMRILKKVLLTVSATVFAFTASVTPAALPQTQIVAEAATMKLNKKLNVKGVTKLDFHDDIYDRV